MNNNLTEMVFILDRSGSMSGKEEDTIGGFNSLIEKQKKEDGQCLVSVVLFDDRTDVIYDRIDISKMPVMTENEYFTRGCTALLDALGGAIHHIANVHKYAREEDVPSKTIFVITTDGMENASVAYTAEKVRAMVRKEQEKYGWEFLFLGANIDAVQTARHYGINPGRAVRYKCDGKGTALNYTVLSETICKYRRTGNIDASWSATIEKDYEERENR